MLKKLIGVFIFMLIILVIIFPVTGTINENIHKEKIVFCNQNKLGFVPGELIVKLKKDITFSRSNLTLLNEKHKVYFIEQIFYNAQDTILDNIYLLHFPADSDILSNVEDYSSHPYVAYAEPNCISSACGIPNDANFSSQWFLQNTGQVFYDWFGNSCYGVPGADINAPDAWDIETGKPDVVVAIIDSGVDYTHPDLAANIWSNMDEIPGNSIDDDGNGFVDDARGWDFVNNDNDPIDELCHGTLCAGVAGAVSNNSIWGAGVAWNCKIMPVQVLNEMGQGYLADIAMGIRYAADNSADVISLSLGGSSSSVMRDAVDYAYGKGVFLCAAAGNSNTSKKFYPAAYDNVTAVAMTNQNDSRVTPENGGGPGFGSNYGDWVDIAAPGFLIYSTMPSYHVFMNDYGLDQYFDCSSGTSFSSPMVAGVAALLLSKNPLPSPDEVKEILCGNVDPYNSTEYIGTGRLNAHKALVALKLSEGVMIKGGLGVKMLITNDATVDVTGINWQINVEGGILGLINKTVNGTVDIPAGRSKIVSTGLFFGLGDFGIIVNVSGVEKTKVGKQFFIFSIVK